VNAEKARREEEFRATQESLSRSAESRERLEREIAEIKGDRAKLNAALVEAAARLQATEGRIGAVEERLSTLSASETGLRGSLEARRGLIVEILAALQRMGRKPPPAVLVRSEDVLSAIRTSMLLGAVLPELKGEADTLAGDLAELVRLKGLIGGERDALRRELAGLGAERERLNALVAARQSRISEVEQTVAGERQRAADLGTKAKSLKELLDRLEGDITSAQKAAEDAKRNEDARARETRERFAAAAFRDPARLTPSTPFAEARGQLPIPVNGKILRTFGSSDGFGGSARGISIVARPGAVVSAPADGWVAFSGPFRSFGRLLIMNAGGGYYLLLAGMDRITVDVGQFVLAGEPVATMGDTTSLSPATGTLETNDPVLYVEFRKDGGSIDPGPWWAKSQGEKVRG
jgi:septal ring factor EnvC (AmiA/AmiB activator)